MLPLVDNPGTVFSPRARVWVVDDAHRVIAGPLVVARRRAYHREWLLGFEGITSRDAVAAWRSLFVAVDESHAHD